MRKLQKHSLWECYTKSYLGPNPTCFPLLAMETRDSSTALREFETQIRQQHYGIQKDYCASFLAHEGRKRARTTQLLTLNH